MIMLQLNLWEVVAYLRELPWTTDIGSWEKSILRKNPVLPIEKLPSLVLSRNMITLQRLIMQFSFNYLSTHRLREVENKWKFQMLSSKSGRGRFRRWSLTRGLKYSDMTWKLSVFWWTGRLREVVATGVSTVVTARNALAQNELKVMTLGWCTKELSELQRSCFICSCHIGVSKSLSRSISPAVSIVFLCRMNAYESPSFSFPAEK